MTESNLFLRNCYIEWKQKQKLKTNLHLLKLAMTGLVIFSSFM